MVSYDTCVISSLAAHNILIQYQCSHNHATDSVFCCTEEKRCSVKICDFDSVKGFRSSCYKADKTTPKTEKEIDKVLGTKGYRAPEVSRVLVIHCAHTYCIPSYVHVHELSYLYKTCHLFSTMRHEESHMHVVLRHTM